MALLALLALAALAFFFLFPMPSAVFMNCAAALLAWHFVKAITRR